ncbi:MAG: hypothetical protein JKY89_01555 [Immundisolibacteraceae bacterium]|nr:hypothetical protein [Immundisolibacteraceae bacterium]
MSNLLPEPFREFESLAAIWSCGTERERHTVRLTSEFEQLQQLYDAVLPEIERIVAHLNQFPMGGLPTQEQNLLNLSFSCMEVALPVEAHGQSTVPGGFEPERFMVDF